MPGNDGKDCPLISIVVPAYNEEKFIGDTLRALIGQDYKGKAEIIVVDNGSTDQTSRIAKGLGVKVIYESRRSIGLARQRGFEVASGEIIAATDADTIVPPNWLSTIADEFFKDRNLVGYSGICEFRDGPWVVRLGSKFMIYPYLAISGSYCGANMAIKSSSFHQIGGFNTDLSINEEQEILDRLKSLGKVRLEPKLKVLTSGRRVQNGIILGFLDYFIFTAIRLYLAKDKSAVQREAVRGPKRLAPMRFIPDWAFVLIIFSIFLSLLTVKPVQAKIKPIERSLGQKWMITTNLAKTHLQKNTNAAYRFVSDF
ncbi:glycosyltransferase [Candidatus Microgenomates bacterium]|nr:glycosyltransferase [Candidatus Microgenomates bacterium]